MFYRGLITRRAFSRPILTMSNQLVPTQARANSSKSTSDEDLGLPAPGEGTPTTLDVSGEGTTVKLSDLGPIVVNVDGTIARISNWAQMADIERETTVRMIGKRNKQRLDALKKAKAEEEAKNAGK
ncbi:hypothetical protein VHEMI00217 [[Torrubiella] hemipterigena]|uniref:Fungal specific transcription factor n=1 Tax=[Torrubiella] hemipterigena TaxID=1531966 RepID=A0A0A1T3V1_9HYPO|nr:hypothetical protein VHEMI00217 [[Torrubiella] hemipterigena]